MLAAGQRLLLSRDTLISPSFKSGSPAGSAPELRERLQEAGAVQSAGAIDSNLSKPCLHHN